MRFAEGRLLKKRCFAIYLLEQTFSEVTVLRLVRANVPYSRGRGADCGPLLFLRELSLQNNSL